MVRRGVSYLLWIYLLQSELENKELLTIGAEGMNNTSKKISSSNHAKDRADRNNKVSFSDQTLQIRLMI